MKQETSFCVFAALLLVCSCSFNNLENIDAPSVISASPSDGEDSVSVAATISIVYSEAVLHAGAEQAFSLEGDGSYVSGICTWSDNAMIFMPSGELAEFTTYFINIVGSMVANTSGNVMARDFDSSFTTGVDSHSPKVLKVHPEHQSVDVSPNVQVEVEFSESMDTASVEQAFSLTHVGSPLDGVFSWTGNSIKFHPNDALEDLTTYRFQLTNTATDVSGNPIDEEVDISFTVGMVVDIAAGGQHSLVAMSSGRVKAWGCNDYGQVGNISSNYITAPVSVDGVSNVVAVAGGQHHSVALLSDGTIRTWGLNDEGQLGNDSNISSNIPVIVSGITNAVAIDCGVSDVPAAGGNHTLALLSDGTVVAWGSNDYGQLGNNSTVDSNVPIAVIGITDAVAIAAGGQHSLAVLSDGTVKAWGRNQSGCLGNSSIEDSDHPVNVGGISTAVSVAAGARHSLALLSDGTAKAWGDDSLGQLGDLYHGWSWSPVTVELMPYAEALSAGAAHSAALMNPNSICMWGADLYGQLGIGKITQGLAMPMYVGGINTAVDIACGKFHTLALLSDGTVMAWGRNDDGELGNGSLDTSPSPVMVFGF
jgi:alpha-tubulin suppressor-like RCC1 family protein